MLSMFRMLEKIVNNNLVREKCLDVALAMLMQKKKIADEIENYLKRKHILLWM